MNDTNITITYLCILIVANVLFGSLNMYFIHDYRAEFSYWMFLIATLLTIMYLVNTCFIVYNLYRHYNHGKLATWDIYYIYVAITFATATAMCVYYSLSDVSSGVSTVVIINITYNILHLVAISHMVLYKWLITKKRGVVVDIQIQRGVGAAPNIVNIHIQQDPVYIQPNASTYNANYALPVIQPLPRFANTYSASQAARLEYPADYDF